jgi:ABC-type branched-subunit amino acid transport system substrate-binding protein
MAEVTEKHRLPMLSLAVTTSIFKKGRKFVFTLLPPAEVYFEGLIDLAAKKGLKTVAIINEANIFSKAVAEGAKELAKKKGLQPTGVSFPGRSPPFSPRAVTQRARSSSRRPSARARWMA